MTLPKNLTLGQIDFGSADAESDRRLSEYFVKAPYVEDALSLKRTLILGRKGSGKSALFSQLERLFRASGLATTIVVQLTPDQYSWTALRQYREQGLMPEQAHTNAWKFAIATAIAGSLADLSDVLLPTQEAKEARDRLRAFIHQNYGKTHPTLYPTATRLLNGIKSFNLEAFGFGVGIERTDKELPLTPMVIDALLVLIAQIARIIGIIVAFDKLDDSWDGSNESKHLLIGLLKATKDLNDRYSRQNPSSGISLLVFLRADIYEGLQFDDKDKHRATEVQIAWDAGLLKKMIEQRLQDEVTTGDLFEEGEMRGSILPFNYLVKRTFLRPREVIQFLQACANIAGRDATEISKEHIRQAEERYSAWKVEDLKQEYRRLHPDFESALEALRQGLHRYDSLEEFEKFLRGRIPQIIERIGSRPIIELLFNASVIGVRLGNAGSPRFRCEDSGLVLPASGAVYVHQSLYRGLSIREKRGTDGDEADS